MSKFWKFLAHTDEYILEQASNNVEMAYLFLFLVVFSESGIILLSFLPGDGFLLAVGIIAATGVLDIWLVLVLLLSAAIIGYWLNYLTGRYLGDHLLSSGRWVRREHLEKTKQFYTRHGGQALIIGRFFPIVRTFVPFLAGVTRMDVRLFLRNTIVGALAWIGFFVLIGYFSGDIPLIRENFFFLYLALVVITLIPPIWTSIRMFIKKKRKRPST